MGGGTPCVGKSLSFGIKMTLAPCPVPQLTSNGIWIPLPSLSPTLSTAVELYGFILHNRCKPQSSSSMKYKIQIPHPVSTTF